MRRVPVSDQSGVPATPPIRGAPGSARVASPGVAANGQQYPPPKRISRVEAEELAPHDASQRRLPVSRIIWDHAGNPTHYVSDKLGITRGQLRSALHKIKGYSNLGGADRTVIYDDGRVTDANGDDIGNILDEVHGNGSS